MTRLFPYALIALGVLIIAFSISSCASEEQVSPRNSQFVMLAGV